MRQRVAYPYQALKESVADGKITVTCWVETFGYGTYELDITLARGKTVQQADEAIQEFIAIQLAKEVDKAHEEANS